MAKIKPHHDYYSDMVMADEIINDRLDSSSYIKFAKQFTPKQGYRKRSESYIEFFDNYKAEAICK